ncbi:hypothetical protein [Leifsonia shinshuensis]|uniref:hypothetical protein n=1 Tax=Leifsonia shinshuensis TaxID=150026 RepID=UPI00285A943C|nr:hypothetical protein [Leifsonia shinshuensis]MDR6973007.1 hypothetical protein [Leifsonia shinshuensis]
MNVDFDSRRSAVLESALADQVRADTSPARVRQRTRRHWFIGGVVAAAAAASIAASAIIVGAPGWVALPASGPSTSPSFAPIPNWPKNDHGQTYGAQGSSPIAPDLVLVEGQDDAGNPVTGYVLSRDLAEAEFGGPEPTSPAQAIKQQEERLKKYPDGQWLPVYKSDGETRVGRFLVGPGQ